MASSYKISSFFSKEESNNDNANKTSDSVVLHSKTTPLMMATNTLFSNIEAELKNTKNNRPA